MRTKNRATKKEVSPGRGVDDHRAVVKIDKEVMIAPTGVRGEEQPAYMSMVRHPDGSIYLNIQSEPPTLYKSSDNGETWTVMSVKLPDVPTKQYVHGLGVNRNGRLFLVHTSAPQELFVSYSDDGGQRWKTSSTNFGRIPPSVPNMVFHDAGFTFIEQPDGTLMFTTTITPSPDYAKKVGSYEQPFNPPNYSYAGTPLDFFSNIVVRSFDGGETWGDPSRVYPQLNPHESSLAIDPHDPNRILIMTRIQTGAKWYTDKQQKALMEQTGNPQPMWKQAALFESTNGGRTFHMPDGGYTSWYGHRGTINWFASNVVVVTHNWGGGGDARRAARISLDGGKTWVDGTQSGTLLMDQSTKFLIGDTIGYISPSIELSNNRYLTAMYHYDEPEVPDEWKDVVGGVIWHLEGPDEE